MSEFGKVCHHGSLERQCEMCWITKECDDWKQQAKKLANSLKETRDASAYLMRFIAQFTPKEFIPQLETRYNGFGKRADEVLAEYEKSDVR